MISPNDVSSCGGLPTDGKQPDRARPVKDAIDAEHGEIVRQAVIAEVVAERSFGLLRRIGSIVPAITKSASAGIGKKPAVATIRSRRPPRTPAKLSSGSPSGNGITAATVKAGRAADDHVDPQRLPPPDRRRVVDADPPMDLVMKTGLLIRYIFIARNLNPVHARDSIWRGRVCPGLRYKLVEA